MQIPHLPATALPQFLHFHPVTLNGLTPQHLGGHPIDRGTVLLFTQTYTPVLPLLAIPASLLLSHNSITTLSKSDPALHAALVAAGPLLSARLAATAFLLLRQRAAAGLGGAHDAWSEYVQFLPATIPLPTTWSVAERTQLTGTSLMTAVAAKLLSLATEFDAVRTTLPGATLEEWVFCDSVFRSRSLTLPGHAGGVLVPVLDFANHSSCANAIYGVGEEGGEVTLRLRQEPLEEGEEVTIDYSAGSKSAAEFVFSYGFIPEDMDSAGSMTLEVAAAEDDPLGRAKHAAWGGRPRVLRVYEEHGEEVAWECAFVYLSVLNEEDGLEFSVLQTVEGERQLQVSWRGEEMRVGDAKELFQKAGEEMREVFELRAVSVLLERVQTQLAALLAFADAQEQERAEAGVVDANAGPEDPTATQAQAVAQRLRSLEETLLLRAVAMFTKQQAMLLASPYVQSYLSRSPPASPSPSPSPPPPADDSREVEIDLS